MKNVAELAFRFRCGQEVRVPELSPFPGGSGQILARFADKSRRRYVVRLQRSHIVIDEEDLEDAGE